MCVCVWNVLESGSVINVNIQIVISVKAILISK